MFDKLQVIIGSVLLIIVLIVAIVYLIALFTKKDQTFLLTITDGNGNVSETVIHSNILKSIDITVLSDGAVKCDFETLEDANLTNMEETN